MTLRLLALQSSSTQGPYAISMQNPLSTGDPYTLSIGVVQFQNKRFFKNLLRGERMGTKQ